MPIGVISDTHDRLPVIDEAVAYFAGQGVNLIVHCGDWKSLGTAEYVAKTASRAGLPVVGVLGNNDTDTAAFLELARNTGTTFALYDGVHEMTVGTKTVAIYHGHHAPTLRRVRADPRYDIVLLGHTHKPKVEQEGGRLLVNPGSTAFAIPRSKQWRPSVAVVDTDVMTAHLYYF